eukprot:TRINITY_DN9817_c0_g1_i1.p1 TRINITY_DN9817_c0_g1~~TRINITY_DN9817_c0_g1_i1.p1  ORF type:complete len:437 (+),score=108.92 TRINITY_DN9817_c0_g1_i1:52-1311(+)
MPRTDGGARPRRLPPRCPVDGKCPLINDPRHQLQYRHVCTFRPCPYLHTFPSHARLFIHLEEDDERMGVGYAATGGYGDAQEWDHLPYGGSTPRRHNGQPKMLMMSPAVRGCPRARCSPPAPLEPSAHSSPHGSPLPSPRNSPPRPPPPQGIAALQDELARHREEQAAMQRRIDELALLASKNTAAATPAAPPFAAAPRLPTPLPPAAAPAAAGHSTPRRIVTPAVPANTDDVVLVEHRRTPDGASETGSVVFVPNDLPPCDDSLQSPPRPGSPQPESTPTRGLLLPDAAHAEALGRRSSPPRPPAPARPVGPTRMCVHCHEPVPSNASFCIHCGRSLKVPLSRSTCTSCGAQLSSRSLYCTRCGARRQGQPEVHGAAATVWCPACPHLGPPDPDGNCEACGYALNASLMARLSPASER